MRIRPTMASVLTNTTIAPEESMYVRDLVLLYFELGEEQRGKKRLLLCKGLALMSRLLRKWDHFFQVAVFFPTCDYWHETNKRFRKFSHAETYTRPSSAIPGPRKGINISAMLG